MTQIARTKKRARRLTAATLLIIVLVLVVALTSWCNRFVGDECVCCRGLGHFKSVYPFLGGRVSAEPYFVWIPGSPNVLLTDHDNSVFLVNTALQDEPEIRQLPGMRGYHPEVTRDGEWLAIGNYETVDVYTLGDGQRIFSIEEASYAQWSPDGQALAVESFQDRNVPDRRQLDYLRPDARQERRTLVDSGSYDYVLATWSRSGDYLVLAASEPDRVANGLADKFHLLSLETGDIVPMVELAGCQQMLTWSPVDDRIVFVGNPNDTRDLFLTELGDDGVRNVTNTADYDEYQPEWSPDGTTLAYIAFRPKSDGVDDREFEQDVYLLNPVTLEKWRLTNTPDEHESFPRWSPDGSRIAYFSLRDNVWYLNIMNHDGSGQRRLVEIGGTP